MIEAIFFDCDGVLLESVELKTEAFISLFSDWPQHRDEIVRLHVENGGMSRFKKFKIICEDLLKIPYGEEKERELAGRFSSLVFEKALACPFVPGAVEFLEAWSERIPLHVISGTPTAELHEIIRRRGLARHFQNALGSPESKGHWVKKLLTVEGYAPENCPFIGDAGANLKAAREAGTPFVGRQTERQFDPFGSATGFPRIPDLTTLAETLGLTENRKNGG